MARHTLHTSSTRELVRGGERRGGGGGGVMAEEGEVEEGKGGSGDEYTLGEQTKGKSV